MYIIFIFLLNIQIDRGFEYATEQFVIQSSNKKIEMPEYIKSRIDMLNSDSYAERENATKELMRLSRKFHRYLYWEINNPNIETRIRIRKIIRRYNICLNCVGTGWCLELKGPNPRKCIICKLGFYSHRPEGIDCPLCDNGYIFNFVFDNIYESYK